MSGFISSISPLELKIDDSYGRGAKKDSIFKPKVGKKSYARGYDPSQVDERVKEMLARPSEIKVIPRSQWPARIEEQEKTKSRISDLLRRKKIPSTDQNGNGYCWAYSTTGCVQVVRAKNRQKHVPLNGHSVAAPIKGGRDQGGWCGQSARYVMEFGISPMGSKSQGLWPEHSRSLANDTEENRKIKLKYRCDEAFIDLSRKEWDDDMTFDQIATCLLLNIPVAGDFNWWGHSVLLCDLVYLGNDNYAIRIRNSWTDGWGDIGFSVLSESKSRPDGAVALATIKGSSQSSFDIPELTEA